MRIVQINRVDLEGERFNGYDLQIALNERGIPAHQIVFDKVGYNHDTICLGSALEIRAIREHCIRFERNMSFHALVYPFGQMITNIDCFKNADIIHCHLLHNYFFSLYDLKKLSNMKHLVWTIHDPWAVTGHCIHPGNCNKWMTGCIQCPDLERPFSLKRDNSSLLWNIKKDIYTDVEITIVIASRWMERFIKKSPLMRHFENVHLIPFGINVDFFAQNRDKTSVRKKYGIGENSFVMFFRAQEVFKGLSVITEMLDILKPTKQVELLTVGYGSLPGKYKKKYRVVDCGWINDEEIMAELYCACDVFLMPSTAESFGLMAIEAMAAKRPVIVMEGTALPDVTYAPECGISIPRNKAAQRLKEIVEQLMQNPGECRYRGEKGLALAKQHYTFEGYVDKHVKLYESVLDINSRVREKVQM